MTIINSPNADLYVDQGSDWSVQVELTYDDGTSINVAGYQFSGALSTSYYADNTSGNLAISVIDAANGQIMLSMNSAVSGNLQSGGYVYDVYMMDTANVVTKILQGILTLNAGVTGNLNRTWVAAGTQNTTPWLPTANSPVDVNNVA